MSSLVVVSHPDPGSLTQHAARSVAEALRATGEPVEFADLAAEGFDPSFGTADLDLFRGTGEMPDDVATEQRRIDRADHLVVVFPMYWWSFPALLKGWIDRVFVNHWAYEFSPGGSFEAKLGRLTVHLLVVAGDDAESFRRHGVDVAVGTQIERGIIEYCGATLGSTTFLYSSDTRSSEELATDVRRIAGDLTARIADHEPAAV
ncbi:NAD(P)H-dependent oxidoreductase [Gordonia soli]|uniref:Flavodoxin-like fold domain-containing protein n=1 Tax=Gordonia soli NBRC 108243 TaxID=1223545 RepID=M0QS50_9ACTN|nr:NAD(P)H-dependent oxidoreductase [Gordonia soli]GAC70832.1 hypothetical protein GS4_42_00100 [Gordonia soli NBRC 108243]